MSILMKFKNKWVYVFLLFVGLYITLLPKIVNTNEFEQFYWYLKNGNEFDAPLQEYVLNDGFVFTEKDSAKGYYSVIYKGTDSFAYTIVTKDLVDLSTLFEKGKLLRVLAQGECNVYREQKSPGDLLVAVGNLAIISLINTEGITFDWQVICSMIYPRKSSVPL